MEVELPIVVRREIDGRVVEFELHANPQHFEESMWKRVVAVFCTGRQHEFRDWEEGENKLILFKKCKKHLTVQTEGTSCATKATQSQKQSALIQSSSSFCKRVRNTWIAPLPRSSGLISRTSSINLDMSRKKKPCSDSF